MLGLLLMCYGGLLAGVILGILAWRRGWRGYALIPLAVFLAPFIELAITAWGFGHWWPLLWKLSGPSFEVFIMWHHVLWISDFPALLTMAIRRRKRKAAPG